ncbi:hypothetical protein [Flavicella sediminum]|uniref:hypothetical protein n=1 Tax=Flavicella sediminum TaxID=2585141 RepID=UPI00111FD845|nr:hypothetical protein [Flavicella sediminum]
MNKNITYNTKFKNLALIILTIILSSCYPNSKKSALKKYKKLIESEVWCEIKSKNKFIFKDGILSQSINGKIIDRGEYKLDVKPSQGLTGEWFWPLRKIEISTFDNNIFLLELDFSSGEEILVLKNHKKKEVIFFSDDCVLSAIDSVAYKVHLKHHYKFISLN